MGIPLAWNFYLAGKVPLDGRTVCSTLQDLSTIPNVYPGLIAYVTNNQNLYLNQGPGVWEKIITNNVDNVNSVTSNFNITEDYNGQVVHVISANSVTGILNADQVPLSKGFNTTIVQMGPGSVTISGGNVGTLRNRLNFYSLAGQYAVASILRQGTTTNYILYGDLV